MLDQNKIVYREYMANPRYGYGAVDEMATDSDGNKGMLRNVFSGKWLTQKAARWIADELNRVYGNGKLDEVNARIKYEEESK